MINKMAAAIMAALISVTLTTCEVKESKAPPYSAQPVSHSQSQEKRPESGRRQISAWVVYWDQGNALDELTVLQRNLEAVCHFSAVFGADGHLSIPEPTANFHRSMLEKQTQDAPLHYLTVVNDVVYENKSSQKDTDVLEPLLADSESRAAHIGELLELSEYYGYDGLEIDYEALHRQKGLAEKFALFCGELWEAARQKGLRLRIVLESSFPADKIKLPQGPDYVVMLYNLHGYHSGPGPKADAAFIRNAADKMRGLPGNTIYALSTGGFDWTANASVKSLTELQAWALLSATSADAQRDSGSGCLYFSYTAEDDSEHTVWFADGETIRYWMDAAGQDGVDYRFALWRMGGNELSSLHLLDSAED